MFVVRPSNTLTVYAVFFAPGREPVSARTNTTVAIYRRIPPDAIARFSPGIARPSPKIDRTSARPFSPVPAGFRNSRRRTQRVFPLPFAVLGYVQITNVLAFYVSTNSFVFSYHVITLARYICTGCPVADLGFQSFPLTAERRSGVGAALASSSGQVI